MGQIEGREHRPQTWPIEEQSLISWWSHHQWRVSGRSVTWRGSWSPHCWPCSAGSSHDQKGQNGQKSGGQNPASVLIWRLVCQSWFKKLSSVSPEWKFHHFLSWVFLPSTAGAINLRCLLQKPINYQKLDKSEENYSKHSVWPLNQSSIHWDWLEIGVSRGRSCTADELETYKPVLNGSCVLWAIKEIYWGQSQSSFWRDVQHWGWRWRRVCLVNKLDKKRRQSQIHQSHCCDNFLPINQIVNNSWQLF